MRRVNILMLRRLFAHLMETGAKRSGANRRTSPAAGSGLEARRPPPGLLPREVPRHSEPRAVKCQPFETKAAQSVTLLRWTLYLKTLVRRNYQSYRRKMSIRRSKKKIVT